MVNVSNHWVSGSSLHRIPSGTWDHEHFIGVTHCLFRVVKKGASRFAHVEKFSPNCFKFVVCNPCQSSPSLVTLVPLWLIGFSWVVFYCSKLLFSGFLYFVSILLGGQNNSKDRDWALLRPFKTNYKEDHNVKVLSSIILSQDNSSLRYVPTYLCFELIWFTFPQTFCFVQIVAVNWSPAFEGTLSVPEVWIAMYICTTQGCQTRVKIDKNKIFCLEYCKTNGTSLTCCSTALIRMVTCCVSIHRICSYYALLAPNGSNTISYPFALTAPNGPEPSCLPYVALFPWVLWTDCLEDVCRLEI